MAWEIKIKKVSNGYQVLIPAEDEDHIPTETVIEIPDTEFGELEAMQTLLYEVIEYFGVIGSKHDKKRLRVNIEDQRKKD